MVVLIGMLLEALMVCTSLGLDLAQRSYHMQPFSPACEFTQVMM